MNFYEVMEKVVHPQLKKLVPETLKIQVPGLAGVWFQKIDSPISFFCREQGDGSMVVKTSISNIYVPTEQIVLEDPNDVVAYLSENIKRWLEIPVEGRTWTRAEDLERRLGTLTGVNLAEELAPYDEKVNLDDEAVLSLDRDLGAI